MENLPLVTIGALNYNNANYVIETLNSIAAQTYQNLELVLVDDKSTDNSLTLIKDWLDSFDRPYTLIEHPVNKGLLEAYNSIFRNAKGEYLSIIATDDLFMPYKIEEQVNIFNSLDETYGLVYGDVAVIDSNSKIIRESNFELTRVNNPNWYLPNGNIYPDLLESFLFYIHSTLIKMKFIRDYNFYFEKKELSEDWYFELFLSTKCKFYGVEKVYAKYRIHNASITSNLWTDEKIWQVNLSHARMFVDVLKFKENSEEDKKTISNKIYNYFLQCSYNKKSNYWKIVATYLHALPTLSFKQNLKLLFDINKIFYKKNSK